MHKDVEFLEFILNPLLDNPDHITIDRTVDEKGVLLTLTVHPDDLGRAIGKNGQTAQSIRSLLRAFGFKNDAHYSLKILDGKNG